VLGVPCLTLRTCRAAVRKSVCSQRRSEDSDLTEIPCLGKLLLCHCLEYRARVEDYVDEDDLSVPYLEPSSSKEGNTGGGEIVEDCHFVPFGYDLSNSKLKRSLLDFGERGVCTVA
jgi:hypothetical protein